MRTQDTDAAIRAALSATIHCRKPSRMRSRRRRRISSRSVSVNLGVLYRDGRLADVFLTVCGRSGRCRCARVDYPGRRCADQLPRRPCRPHRQRAVDPLRLADPVDLRVTSTVSVTSHGKRFARTKAGLFSRSGDMPPFSSIIRVWPGVGGVTALSLPQAAPETAIHTISDAKIAPEEETGPAQRLVPSLQLDYSRLA
jgi:hypothetical protein